MAFFVSLKECFPRWVRFCTFDSEPRSEPYGARFPALNSCRRYPIPTSRPVLSYSEKSLEFEPVEPLLAAALLFLCLPPSRLYFAVGRPMRARNPSNNVRDYARVLSIKPTSSFGTTCTLPTEYGSKYPMYTLLNPTRTKPRGVTTWGLICHPIRIIDSRHVLLMAS